MIDLTGQKFGWLVAIERIVEPNSTGRNITFYLCKCDCGNTKKVAQNSLRNLITKSCGCQRKPSRLSHGWSGTKTYYAYKDMKKRCYDSKNKSYSHYGARGISVCERWQADFLNFLEDMGEVPDGFTLERIDYNGNYEPSNCRWASKLEQARNKSNNVYLTYQGKTQLAVEWAEQLGIPAHTIRERINQRGWSVEDALTIPVGQGFKTRLSTYITANGVTKTLVEWANELGVGRSVIEKRIDRGWSNEDAVSIPNGCKRPAL